MDQALHTDFTEYDSMTHATTVSGPIRGGMCDGRGIYLVKQMGRLPHTVPDVLLKPAGAEE